MDRPDNKIKEARQELKNFIEKTNYDEIEEDGRQFNLVKKDRLEKCLLKTFDLAIEAVFKTEAEVIKQVKEEYIDKKKSE